MATPLTDDQIQQALQELDGWAYEDGKLQRHLQFGSFREAMSFLVRVAFHAEAAGHHPEIHNVYNKVDLALATHDAGGKVTQKDVDLAKEIHGFNWQIGS